MDVSKDLSKDLSKDVKQTVKKGTQKAVSKQVILQLPAPDYARLMRLLRIGRAEIGGSLWQYEYTRMLKTLQVASNHAREEHPYVHRGNNNDATWQALGHDVAELGPLAGASEQQQDAERAQARERSRKPQELGEHVILGNPPRSLGHCMPVNLAAAELGVHPNSVKQHIRTHHLTVYRRSASEPIQIPEATMEMLRAHPWRHVDTARTRLDWVQ